MLQRIFTQHAFVHFLRIVIQNISDSLTEAAQLNSFYTTIWKHELQELILLTLALCF